MTYIISYQGFLVRPLLREPRPQVHYKSQPDATAQRETQKSTNVKSLTIDYVTSLHQVCSLKHYFGNDERNYTCRYR